MNNILHKKGWNSGTDPVHVEPPPIPLSKEMCNGKSDKYFINMKLRIDTTYSTSDLYNFKMSLFDHGEPEEFLLFIRNFNMNLAATGTLDMDTEIQYIGTLVRREALYKFDLLSDDVENIETLNVYYYIKGLALYFSPVNSLSKKKRAMRHGMKKTDSPKVIRYAVRLIDLHEYLASFLGATLSDNIDVT